MIKTIKQVSEMNYGKIKKDLRNMGFRPKQINGILETLKNNPPEKEVETTEDLLCYIENNS